MEKGKFHPHTQSKGVRKSRDQSAKSTGVKVERKARGALPQDELERAISKIRFIHNKPTSIKMLEQYNFDDNIIKKAIDEKFEAGRLGEEKDPIVERFPHAEAGTGRKHAGEFRKITIYPEREDYFECKVCGGLEAID
ncbi:MAG: hypothetical protein KJI69_05505 [Patescibacteria group bacterium]|nr:hypothetical protein [Patescibacteria group bacterium]